MEKFLKQPNNCVQNINNNNNNNNNNNMKFLFVRIYGNLNSRPCKVILSVNLHCPCNIRVWMTDSHRVPEQTEQNIYELRKQNLRQTIKPAIHLTLLDQWLHDLQGSPLSYEEDGALSNQILHSFFFFILLDTVFNGEVD